MNRIISNHKRCKESLNRFKIVNSPKCECGLCGEVNRLIFRCEKLSVNQNEIATAVKKMGLETMDIQDVIAKSLDEHRHDVMIKISTFVETRNLEI
jgi:hypothetical protein